MLQPLTCARSALKDSLTIQCQSLPGAPRLHCQTPCPGPLRPQAGRGMPNRQAPARSLPAIASEPSVDSVAAEPSSLPAMPHIVVFSGGTAFNSVAGHFKQLTHNVTHVLPVTDDGGSTAEVVRVLGGPAVGDIRSRCLRLAEEGDAESEAVRQLLGHRLSSTDPEAARQEWYRIVEGEHPLWQDLTEPYKHTIRAFLVHFQANILRHASRRFNFQSGSVGNFFFAGARIFFRSLEAAIFLFSRVARIPEGTETLPALPSEGALRLGAELADGSWVIGQSAISHPAAAGAEALSVDKACAAPLPAAIRRAFYLSSDGDGAEHEVAPDANPRTLAALGRAQAVIYGMGSLYTSLVPHLVLRGVGETIAAARCPKILMLNGAVDRETGQCLRRPGAMAASDVLLALTDALNRRGGRRDPGLDHPPSAYCTAVLAPRGGGVEVDADALAALGVRVVRSVSAEWSAEAGAAHYDPDALVAAVRDLLA
ncbi:hypothetical protein ACKKBF_B38970 [Auxenochlorella protothecoides x Auxenochlorella symbiontica]|uniref:Gluconeogenesis factor n=2 Tax=Auxenochlorella protothecoides TaxID=3075 RepID=A0A1D1ZUR2_AUXPR